jgi:hypothetical protein
MKCSFAMTGNILLILLIASSFLVGCGPSTPTATAVPTIGQETLMAAAIKTVAAQMTAEALRNPTATATATYTPVPPTATLAPTDTPAPTIPPTATATTRPAFSAKFLYATDIKRHAFEYTPNEKFSVELGFENTGTIAWEPGSRLKLINFTGGGDITVQTELELGHSVAPGEKAVFDLWAFGSEYLGVHQAVFQLYSKSGVPIPGGVGVFAYKSV